MNIEIGISLPAFQLCIWVHNLFSKNKNFATVGSVKMSQSPALNPCIFLRYMILFFLVLQMFTLGYFKYIDFIFLICFLSTSALSLLAALQCSYYTILRENKSQVFLGTK